MKLVVAIVRPEKLSDVLVELFKAEVQGLTISEVRGHGGEIEQVETYRGTTVKMALSEKVRLEIGVSDSFVQPTVEAIMRGARTGSVGDGKIFVLPVEKIYRIRSREEDTAAAHSSSCSGLTADCWAEVDCAGGADCCGEPDSTSASTKKGAGKQHLHGVA